MTVLIDALESGHEAQDVVPRALPHRLAASLLPVCSVGPAARTESSSFRTRTLRQPHRCILRHGGHGLAVALLVFTRIESTRLGIRRRWLVLIAVLTVGVSLALPLFLYLRELELERKPNLA